MTGRLYIAIAVAGLCWQGLLPAADGVKKVAALADDSQIEATIAPRSVEATGSLIHLGIRNRVKVSEGTRLLDFVGRFGLVPDGLMVRGRAGFMMGDRLMWIQVSPSYDLILRLEASGDQKNPLIRDAIIVPHKEDVKVVPDKEDLESAIERILRDQVSWSFVRFNRVGIEVDVEASKAFEARIERPKSAFHYQKDLVAAFDLLREEVSVLYSIGEWDLVLERSGEFLTRYPECSGVYERELEYWRREAKLKLDEMLNKED